VNGKTRAEIRVPVQAERARIEKTAVAEANVQKFIAGKAIRKVIVVPDKLVNIVV
jgi:leucyl-tRNA synthetase